MVKIAPSILSADFMRLGDEIQAVEQAGADIIHLDVMDGHFVPNLTFGMPIIRQIAGIASKPLDAHLMVTNPQDYFQPLSEAGLSYVSFHPETVYHVHREVGKIRELGMKAGLALNPAKPVQDIFPILNELDFVLFMSVNPGFGGQSFLPLVYDKIKALREEVARCGAELEIEIDGGVTHENIGELAKAGVTMFVAGSYIFKADRYEKQIERLRCSVN